MVSSVTNYGRSGVYDHMVQRLTAIIIALYTVFLFGYVVAVPELQFEQWQGLFAQTWMKIFSLAALVSICAHAWIGMWTTSTDYLKPVVLRFLFQIACASALFVYLVWGIQILWGV
ncbi:MAG: hypothetical protein RL217_1202 [Pseudomonadota bacterium]|jgi:succinate dehydrogenase / fumarate reductase membrane anchor subunit